MGDQKMSDAVNIEDDLDDEQLEEYKEMVEALGTFPDKVKINTLSMVAEDHAQSYKNAELIYNIIRESLISASVHCDRKLPLVYVVDSILKNVKGEFIPIVEKDASNWLPVVYRALPEEKRAKLEKVWNLWNKGSKIVFAKDKWEEMGRCFSEKSVTSGGENDTTMHAELSKTGLSLGKDGRLVLVPALRGAMQKILDEIQEEENEMEKVSLERLAAINADLLVQIKENAESSLRTGNNSNNNNESSDAPISKSAELDFLIETRPPEILNRSKTWEKLNTSEGTKDARDIIANLHKLVRESTNIEKRYTQQEAMEMTRALSTVSVTATLLTNTLQEIKDESEKDRIKSKMGSINTNTNTSGLPRSLAPSYFTIDKSLFTNDGIKKLNQAVIGLLYEVGLPFVSSGDGRRFATQLELSKHMDALFKKGQLEKSIATTQERGWYDSNDAWCGGDKPQQESGVPEQDGDVPVSTGEDDDADPDTFTMPADESRDRCAICGINFKMLFDNEDGIFKYNNCREIEVLNDEAAANDSEDMLVHVTCWRNLGSPELLTAEQIVSRF